MIANKDSIDEANSDRPLPNSKKIYVSGQQHADLRVPFREISLAPTKSMDGRIEVNEPVRVYDTSGPWGDADATPELANLGQHHLQPAPVGSYPGGAAPCAARSELAPPTLRLA